MSIRTIVVPVIASVFVLATVTLLAAPSYQVTDLGTLGGPTSSAAGINASGQVVGSADTSSGERHAFLYSNGTMADLGTLGGVSSSAHGINASGQVVGYAFTPPYYETTRAFLYSNGTMTDLNSLIPTGWTLQSATAINDSGQIVGYGINASGNTDALLLTPIPEPSTIALFGIGAASFLACAWRRRRHKA